MKLSKGGLLSLFVTPILPIVGVFLAFISLDRKNAKLAFLSISLFTSSVALIIPPYQDLYRRFYETYFIYNTDTSFYEILYGHVDIIFYIITYYVKILGLPFFIVPAASVFIATYAMLSSLDAMFKHSSIEYSLKKIKLSYICVFCFINILVIGMGIRFGCASAIAVRAIIYLVVEKRRIAGLLVLAVSIFLHFSMVMILFAFIISLFMKINRSTLIPLGVAIIVLSKFVLPVLISYITIFGIAHYAQTGYVDGKFAQVDTTLNSLIVAGWRYFLSIIFIFGAFRTGKHQFRGYENFVIIYILLSCCTFMSYIAFNRYLTEIGLLFYVLLYVTSNREKVTSFAKFVLLLSIINLLFNNIYLQRRPIELGEMWTSLYTPMILRVNYNESDFEKYLIKIDGAGDWIGHELKSNQ